MSWAPPSHSGRSQLLADKLGIQLWLVHYLKQRSGWTPLKYLLQAIKTLLDLARKRPRVIFVQDPPILASLVVWFYGLFSGARLIIDSHTDALLASWWQWSMPLHRFLSRRAICTIVTNDYLRQLVESWGAPALVLADVPTDFARRPHSLGGGFNIAMVSSFSYDEPLYDVFEVARRIPDVHFHVTGNLKLANHTRLAEAPQNVHFTGFLATEDYYGLLDAADAVMVLTTEDHTLQWGACEAVSLGTPVITSDWPFLRSYFNKGTIHVENTVQSIYAGVMQMKTDWKELKQGVLTLREERKCEWDCKQDELMQLIQNAFARS